MPTLGKTQGSKYVPTPVPFQSAPHTSTFSEINNDVISNRSISPIIQQSSPPRTPQKPTLPKTNPRPNLKTKSDVTKWSTTKKVVVGCIVAGIVIAVVVTAIVLGIILSQKSDAATNNSAQTSASIAYWSFDSITTDLYNVYNGTTMGGASFLLATNTQPYVGNGEYLSLTAASSQYFSISTPFVDLTYKSFTIEAWIYPSISTTGDYGIFGQCQCASCSNECLYLIIRSYRLYVSFMNNDLSGNATLTTNTWYHIAFVYNYDTKQQILYVNGYQDAIKSNADSYQGTSGTIWIGASLVYVTMSYYGGYIDNFKITTKAKSASELLDAATLTAYFSFDMPSSTYDSGPLGLNGTANNTAIVNGRVNEAMRFSGTSSYFYAYGVYQMGFGVYAGKPFSVSLWINPAVTISCSIVQLAYTLGSSMCHNLIGFYSTLGVTAQIVTQGWSWPTIYGPFATLNTWKHVSVTYSVTNGLRLYVDGVYFGNTGGFSFSNSGRILYLELGYIFSCSSSTISNVAYQGSIDEVHVHSREISQSEVTALANP